MSINYNKLKTHDATYIGRKLDAVVDALKSVTLNQGRGYKLRRTPLGTVVDISPSNGGGAQHYPFDITVVPADSEVDITIRPGSVNHLLPTNYDETFTVDPTALAYVKVKAFTDGKKVTSCQLFVNETEPAPQEPAEFSLPTSVEVLIGVIVAGTPYRMIGLGSIQLVGYEEQRADKSPAAGPGELAYTPFMVWKVEII